MMADVNETYNHFVVYRNVKLLCSVPKTNMSVISQLKKKIDSG